MLQTAYVLVMRLTQQTETIQVDQKAQFLKRVCTEETLEIFLSLFDIPEREDADKLEWDQRIKGWRKWLIYEEGSKYIQTHSEIFLQWYVIVVKSEECKKYTCLYVGFMMFAPVASYFFLPYIGFRSNSWISLFPYLSILWLQHCSPPSPYV